MHKPCLWLLCASIWVFGAACGTEEEFIPVHMLFGNVTSTSIDASSRKAHIKLVSASGLQSDPAFYSTSCRLVGPSCTYQITFVQENEYTVFAFIDLNGNASYDMLPDSGDLTCGSRPLFFLDKTELDFDDAAWRRMP